MGNIQYVRYCVSCCGLKPWNFAVSTFDTSLCANAGSFALRIIYIYTSVNHIYIYIYGYINVFIQIIEYIETEPTRETTIFVEKTKRIVPLSYH